MTRAGRPQVAIVTPYMAAANNGNWHTAARWASFLRRSCRVNVEPSWHGQPCDLLIALHARRSADSIRRFADAHPDRPQPGERRMPLRAQDLPAPRLRAVARVRAAADEIEINPRARSAVMRVAERTETPWPEATP